jgi:hypothetical protein
MKSKSKSWREKLNALVKKTKEEPEDPIISLQDYAGRYCRIHLSNAEAFMKEQEELRQKADRGEIWDERKGLSPEQKAADEALIAEILAHREARLRREAQKK